MTTPQSGREAFEALAISFDRYADMAHDRGDAEAREAWASAAHETRKAALAQQGREVGEPGPVDALVSAANATLAANPHDETMWTLEAAVAPFNATKPAECENGCPPQQVCDYCQIAARYTAAPKQQAVDEAMVKRVMDAGFHRSDAIAALLAALPGKTEVDRG